MPTPVAVKLDEDVHSRVKVLAEARDRSPHWMMREAIAQYVEREEKREAFRQDGIRAWNAYPRLMLGWPSSPLVTIRSRLSATTDLVARGAGRCAAPLSFSC
jgi:predicted transcriptional regulator